MCGLDLYNPLSIINSTTRTYTWYTETYIYILPTSKEPKSRRCQVYVPNTPSTISLSKSLTKETGRRWRSWIGCRRKREWMNRPGRYQNRIQSFLCKKIADCKKYLVLEFWITKQLPNHLFLTQTKNSEDVSKSKKKIKRFNLLQ